MDAVKIWPLLFLVALNLSAAGQSGSGGSLPIPQSNQAVHVRSWRYTSIKPEPDDLRQELDAAAAALSKIPADPIFHPDPLDPIFQPIDRAADQLVQSERLKLGVTYTFLSQYATVTPDGVRHDQSSGRLDFSGAGKHTTMAAQRDRSVCSCAPEPISASANSSI